MPPSPEIPPRAGARRRRVLYTKAPVSPERMLVNRVLLVLLMIGLVIALLWFDRDGLKDNLDGHVSFSDVIYFTMITITTVGYGDIVPVTDTARIIDALFVTPVRIFVWFVFLGTAYQFVIQKVWEGLRMSRLRERLADHVVICGFGQSGSIAAKEIVAKGTPAEKIVVIDSSEQCMREAADAGHIGLHGDPTQERILRDAGVERARAVIVSLGRDDTTVLAVLTLRHLNPKVKIIASVWEEENVKLVRLAGANVTLMPSQVNGYLLADSVSNWYTADYLLDLLTSDGRVVLSERMATPADVGKSMRDVAGSIVVRVYRNGKPIGFWEQGKNVIEHGDLLLVIEPTAEGLDGARTGR
jgi:voltage-gated potassium channel